MKVFNDFDQLFLENLRFLTVWLAVLCTYEVSSHPAVLD